MAETDDSYSGNEDSHNLEGESGIYSNINESASEIWEDFLDTIRAHYDFMTDDPYEYARGFLGMVWSKRKNLSIAVLVAAVILLCIRTGPASNGIEKQRFLNVTNSVVKFVKEDEKLDPVSAQTIIRLFAYTARRLSGIDDSFGANQPIVLLFAATNQTHVDSFTHKFADLFTQVPRELDTFVAEVDCDSTESRIDFETRIFTRLSEAEAKHKILILNNIDQLSQMAPLVLHSLADNESSPFKEIIILASVTLEKMPKKLVNTKQCTDLISNHLLSTWASEEMSRDQIQPIISRITAFPACIKY